LCANPSAHRIYCNAKTCEGNPYTYPTNGNTGLANIYACSANSYAHTCPTDAHANPYTYAN